MLAIITKSVSSTNPAVPAALAAAAAALALATAALALATAGAVGLGGELWGWS